MSKVTTVSFSEEFVEKMDKRARELGLTRSAYIVFATNFEMALNKEASEYEKIFDLVVGFICNSCNQTYKEPPISGKCYLCGGEIQFLKKVIGISKTATI